MDKSIEYLLSLNILNELKSMDLILEDEFIKIDLENKKCFKEVA